MTGHRLLATAHVGGKPGCHPVGCQNTHQRLEGEFFMKNSPFNSLLTETDHPIINAIISTELLRHSPN